MARLRVATLAEKANCSDSAIYILLNNGTLPGTKTARGNWVINCTEGQALEVIDTNVPLRGAHYKKTTKESKLDPAIAEALQFLALPQKVRTVVLKIGVNLKDEFSDW